MERTGLLSFNVIDSLSDHCVIFSKAKTSSENAQILKLYSTQDNSKFETKQPEKLICPLGKWLAGCNTERLYICVGSLYTRRTVFLFNVL